MTNWRNAMTTSPSTNRPDVLLVGAGIMSATLAVLLKELDPSLKIELYEVLGSEDMTMVYYTDCHYNPKDELRAAHDDPAIGWTWWGIENR